MLQLSVGGYYNAFSGNPEAVNLAGFPGLAWLPLITQGLLDRGYDEESIQKILGSISSGYSGRSGSDAS